MRIEIGKESPEAIAKLPENHPDGSRIGVNYTDVIIKGIGAELRNGDKISCKRRGLQLTLTIGDKKGEAIMRRLEHGPDPKNILQEALKEAATAADAQFIMEDGTLFLDLSDE